MLNSLITGKVSNVTKDMCWDCCINIQHGVTYDLHNKWLASDIAIYKAEPSFCLNFFIQQPALEIEPVEHIVSSDPRASLFCSQVTKLQSHNANFLCFKQYLAKVPV